MRDNLLARAPTPNRRSQDSHEPWTLWEALLATLQPTSSPSSCEPRIDLTGAPKVEVVSQGVRVRI